MSLKAVFIVILQRKGVGWWTDSNSMVKGVLSGEMRVWIETLNLRMNCCTVIQEKGMPGRGNCNTHKKAL